MQTKFLDAVHALFTYIVSVRDAMTIIKARMV